MKTKPKPAYQADSNGLILQEGDYLLLENQSMASSRRPVALLCSGDCIGIADCPENKDNAWRACLISPALEDPKAVIVAKRTTRNLAIKALWDNRHY
jgi:hypothetical protein